MAHQKDIVEEIAAAIPTPRSMRWQDRVAPEHVETLDAIRAAYKAGKFGTRMRPAFVAIAEILKARGIATVGRNGVRAWLESQ